MKQFLLSIILISFSFVAFAQAIFDSNIHTAIPFGDVNSPATEMAQNIIDQDPNTKFLDFNNLDGIGFEVDLGLGNEKIATSISVVTANDAPERDPLTFEVFGSNNNLNFVSIATGEIPCISDRFLSRTFQFANTESYSVYRINFEGNCSPANIHQIADVQLFQVSGNAPTLGCPGDLIVNSNLLECGANPTFTVTAEDVEDGTITAVQVLGPSSGGFFPIGNTPVVFSAADSDGNVVSCEFTITVEDNELPVVSCPDDIFVTVDIGSNGAVVNYDVVAIDNCGLINPLAGFFSLANINNKAYYLSDTLLTPEVALVEAFNQDGVLGTIRTGEDNETIRRAIATNVAPSLSVLIGYNDLTTEGEFLWISDDPATYNNWNEGEPNNSGANMDPENYVIMLSNGLWNDVAGSDNEFPYLHEIPYQINQTAGLASGAMFPAGTTLNSFVAADIAGNTTNCEFSVIIDNGVNTENLAFSKGIQLSPNPTSGFFEINNYSGVDIQQIIIRNNFGQVISVETFDPSISKYTFHIDQYPVGIYLVDVLGKKGRAIKRLIKQ